MQFLYPVPDGDLDKSEHHLHNDQKVHVDILQWSL